MKFTRRQGLQGLAAGTATVTLDFTYDGGGVGKGGSGKIIVNGVQVAEGKISETQSNTFSSDDTADVGEDGGTPVSEDYNSPQSKFTGKLTKARIEVK